MTFPSSLCTPGLCPGATTSKRPQLPRDGGTSTKNTHLEPEHGPKLGNALRSKGHSCPSQPHKLQMLWGWGKGAGSAAWAQPHTQWERPDHGSDLQLDPAWGIRRETAPPKPTQPSQREEE